MEEFIENAHGILLAVGVCALIVAVVFGLLGGLLALDFVLAIAGFAFKVLVVCIYVSVALWVISFEWDEAPILKTILAGVVLAALNGIAYYIFEWSWLYTAFVVCALIVAVATVIGLMYLIFGDA